MTRLLLIEDDPHLRDVITRSLRPFGYEVTVADDGAEGLVHWDRAGADVVVTDLHMPNVDGIELILALRARSPSLPIVAISGGDARASFLALESAGDLGATVLLPKPFTGHDLADALRRALDEGAGRSGSR